MFVMLALLVIEKFKLALSETLSCLSGSLKACVIVVDVEMMLSL